MTVEKLAGRKDLSMIRYSVTARKSIPTDDLLLLSLEDYDEDDAAVVMERKEHEEHGSNTHEELQESTQNVKRQQYKETLQIVYDAAISILTSRRFTEYTLSPSSVLKTITFHAASPSSLQAAARRRALGGSDSGGELAALIVKPMGDYRRYGIQPLRLAYEEHVGTTCRSVGFYTLVGGHWDGEIRISIDRVGIGGVRVDSADAEDEDEDEEEIHTEEEGIVVSVSMVIPKKGRKLSNKLSQRIVTSLADSIVRSTVTEARRNMVQHAQSRDYRGKTKGLASERRKIRYENAKKLEEMERDRRRRWQQANPDAGKYRPSGHRMQSPNNC